jgi:hypothetical protein
VHKKRKSEEKDSPNRDYQRAEKAQDKPGAEAENSPNNFTFTPHHFTI